MKIIYHCSWIPQEIFRAMGITPITTPNFLPQHINITTKMNVGNCPYMEFFNAIAEETDCDAVIFTTMCDQMRRKSEIYQGNKPSFCFNLPSTCHSTAAYKLYKYEIQRLIKWLEKLTGKKLDYTILQNELINSFEHKKSFFQLTTTNQFPAREIEIMDKELYETGAFHTPSSKICYNQKIPLLLVGSPTSIATLQLANIIEQFDGHILYNLSESGWHNLPTEIDKRLIQEDPIEAIIDAYSKITGIFHRPNNDWYLQIDKIIKSGVVKGVVFWQQAWCDLWHGELQRFKQWCEIPVINLTANDHGEVDAHTIGRIEAFIEILKD